MLIPSCRIAHVALVAGLFALPAAAADLSTLTGKKLTGDLVAVNAEMLTFRTAEGEVTVPLKEIYALEFGSKVVAPPQGAKFDEIELIDSSIIRCSQFKIKRKAVEPTLFPATSDTPLPAVTLPLDNLFTVLRGADDPKRRAEWKKLVAGRGKRDLFVVTRGDGFEPVPGTVIEGDDEGDAITFERETGGRTTFKLIRASGGLVFNQPPRGEIPPTVCKVVDVFGNVLTARAVELAGSGLKVTTVSGATFEYPSLAGVAKLDFAQGNIAYLSDLDPQVDAPEPVPGVPHFTFLKDKTDDNAPLKLDGQTFGKGLWISPDTTLTFRPNGEYREFKALVGVDESVQIASSAVRLIIEADGKVVFSETITRKDKPRPLNLDVNGVNQLKITVEREGLFLANQVNLAEARFQK
jgi:hypothetical protein